MVVLRKPLMMLFAQSTETLQLLPCYLFRALFSNQRDAESSVLAFEVAELCR